MPKLVSMWLAILAGGLIYQTAKLLFGFSPHYNDLVDAAFWSAFTLIVVWWRFPELSQ